MGKTKWVFAALKLTKMAPLLSMLLTTAAYSMFFGWPYAAGMVGLIFVHEAGHAVAFKYYGIPTGPITFVPFMGAYIGMKDRPRNVYEEAVVALGGPLLGTAGACAVAAYGAATGSQLCLALADFGFMINLFNLLPIGTLDSPRFTAEIDAAEVRFSGAGHGHGVGFCQWGSRGLALAGRSALQILQYYYPGSATVRLRG